MPLVAVCSRCNIRLAIPDDRPGTTFACPDCGSPVSASTSPPPLPTSSHTPASSADSNPDLLPVSSSASAAPVGTVVKAAPVPPKLRFVCPVCHKVYKARVEDFGKKMKCKSCDTVSTIPGGPPQSWPQPAEDAEPEEEQPPSSPSFWRDPVKLALSVACICCSFAILFLLFTIIALAKESTSVSL